MFSRGIDENATALQRGKAGARSNRAALGEVNNGVYSAAAVSKEESSKPASSSAVGGVAFASESSRSGVTAEQLDYFDKINVDDIDAEDHEDVLCVTEYVPEIYRYLRQKEVRVQPSCTYMAHQSDVNEKMRGILVDWLVDVHLKFKLLEPTMHLTVNIIDRFLQLKQVARQKLQLVGVTAMLIASKYEEIYAPEVRDFVYITDRAYNRDEILRMERLMLNTLGFNLSVPTTHTFLSRYMKASGPKDKKKTELYAKFLVELAMPEYKMLRYYPSTLDAAAICLARQVTGAGDWNQQLVKYTQYTESSLASCMADLKDVLKRNGGGKSTLKAAFKKYSSSRFDEVARLPLPW